jgi:hypothetical protein
VKRLLVGIAAYAGFNFLYFIYAHQSPMSSAPIGLPGASSLLELRLFTGHLMLFYFLAFATLLSAACQGVFGSARALDPSLTRPRDQKHPGTF